MELNDELRKALKEQLTASPRLSKETVARCYRYNNGRPFHSDALGVNPSQIKEATEALRARGVTAEFDKSGRCIVTSEKQYQQVARAIGLKDGRDGYQASDYEGNRIFTGREVARGQEMVQRRIMNGYYDNM